MSDDPITSDEDVSAAEYSLRLLAGEEARHAAERAAADPAFAQEVARWRGRFATLEDETSANVPPSDVWQRIAAATAPQGAANDNTTALRRQLLVWKSAAGGLGALAASLALVLAFAPRSLVPGRGAGEAPQAPLVALLGSDGQAAKVVASWSPGARQLVLAVPGDLPPDPGHSRELWVIPAGGKPRSMGTMPASKQMHMRLAEALADLLSRGATIAISVEPTGGSPTGQPTGPVIASGALNPA